MNRIANWLLLPMALIAAACAGDDPIDPSPQTDRLMVACDQDKHCIVTAEPADGNRFVAYEGPLRLPSRWHHGDRVHELRSSCGSPCTSSIFVNMQTQAISRPFPDVVAVDSNRGLVAFVDAKGVHVGLVFDSRARTLAVQADLSPAATARSVIREATFTEDGLDLVYLSGPDYSLIGENVPLDLAVLTR